VNKKLDYLITNDTDTNSSKMKKTIELNDAFMSVGSDRKIIILNEQDLINMIEVK
jgi:hypothetical protein